MELQHELDQITSSKTHCIIPRLNIVVALLIRCHGTIVSHQYYFISLFDRSFKLQVERTQTNKDHDDVANASAWYASLFCSIIRFHLSDFSPWIKRLSSS